jgi:hypothetical protein
VGGKLLWKKPELTVTPKYYIIGYAKIYDHEVF